VTDPPPLRIDAPWLTEGPLARLLDVLDGDGEESRVIGGAVRNALLGLPPGDLDVATTALPDEVMRRAEAAGFKTVPTGVEHGTVTAIVEGRPIEVTTLRHDVETFGRKAIVHFGRDWKADAERRDFTINALSVRRDGTVVDLVGGAADVAARRVRFIGDPAERIREDYLRILRFFRFHAAYGAGAPDPAGLHAAIALRAGLDRLSRERVRMEIVKLLVAPGAAATLEIMADAGLIEPILGVPMATHVARLARMESALALSPDAIMRLGALAVHVPDDADRLGERLRLSNAERERLRSMADRWRGLAAALRDESEAEARNLLYRLGPERYRDRSLFSWLRSGAAPDDAGWLRLATLPERWQAPRFPLKAAAFLARDVPKGPALGAALAEAEAAWIAAGFPQEPAALEPIVNETAAHHRG
jgi:poly(A) polymerase